MTKRVIGALAALGVLSSGMAAYAVTATDTLQVSVDVINECTVTATDAYMTSALTSAAASGAGNVSISCGAAHGNQLDSVKFTSANYATGTAGWKMVKASSDPIPYTLKSGSSSIAYNTDVKTLATAKDPATGWDIPVNVAAANVGTTIGNFSDTLTVTVEYSVFVE